ncbi:MAG TPA: antibiotic biosynthesis monooxygenase [Chloroflexia bacterium]|nr:antibiotic biosynthesis monooxygenase [Chloroflexia bacterium]
MYAAIRQSNAKPGALDEVVRRVDDDLMPALTGMPGFLSYYLITGADAAVTTVSVFETEAEAEACNQFVVRWIAENLRELVARPPDALEGRVAVYRAQAAAPAAR